MPDDDPRTQNLKRQYELLGYCLTLQIYYDLNLSWTFLQNLS